MLSLLTSAATKFLEAARQGEAPAEPILKRKAHQAILVFPSEY